MIENEYIKKHLSFFHIQKYSYPKEHLDIFNIPRPSMNVCYIESGYVKLRYQNKTTVVNAGSFIFIPQSSIYTATWCGTQITLHYNFSHFSSFYKEKDWSIQSFIPSCPQETVAQLYYFLNFNNNTEQAAYVFLSKFFSLLSELHKSVRYSKKNNYGKIKKAIKYIEENFDKKFQVHELAKICNMSDTQFFNEFKNVTNYTPIQYKNIITIHQIQRKLKETNISIKELAEEFNFASTYYFCKLFKSLVGQTPTEYRNEYK